MRKTFSTGQNLLKEILRKKRSVLTQSIKKSFLIDPLNTNNALDRDSLTLKACRFELRSLTVSNTSIARTLIVLFPLLLFHFSIARCHSRSQN